MRSFALLLKIQLLGLFGINKALHADAAKAKRSMALAALAVVGIAALVALYVSSIAQAFVALHLEEAIPLVAVLVGAVAGAVAAFLKANGVLFAFKDYDLVMSLPVPTSTVALSRIASLYAMSLLFGSLVMVPAFAVYAGAAGVTGAGIACMALSIVLAPLLPLAAAVVLAALIAAVSARFRHANIVVVVLTTLATLALVAASFALSGQGGDPAALSDMGAELTAQMANLYAPAAWAAAGIVQGDAAQFALFALVNVAAAIALAVVLARLFVPVNTLLMSSFTRGTFSFETGKPAVRSSSAFRALLAKEARLLLATPIYALNTCIGNVMVLVAAVAAAVASGMGALQLDALPPELAGLAVGFLPWMVAFFFGISSTTAASVSLEGSARWLMLTAPVPARTVLAAKAALNLAFAVPTAVVAGALLDWAFRPDLPTALMMFVVPLAFCLFATFFGLALDARRPRYDWTTVYEPVKRGLPVFVVVLGGVALAGVGFAATATLGVWAAFALAVLVGAGSLALYRETAKRGLTE